MADDEKNEKPRTILDLIMRLACVYLAATFFFNGLEYWRDGETLQAYLYFSLVFSQLDAMFGWHKHKSKIVRVIAWIGIFSVFVFFILSRLAL